MSALNLILYLSPQRALASGSPVAGYLPLPIPSDFTEEQRALLGRHTREPEAERARGLGLDPHSTLALSHVWPAAPTWDAVWAAIAEAEAEAAARAAQQEADRVRDRAALIERLRTDPWAYVSDEQRQDSDPDVCAALARLDNDRATLAARAADVLVALPIEAWGWSGCSLRHERHRELDSYPAALSQSVYDALPAELPRRAYSAALLDPRVLERLRARRDQHAAEQEAAEQEAAEREAERRQQIAALVADYGDDVDRARLAEGLLAESEALDLIRDGVLAPISLAPYQRIRESDLPHDPEHCAPYASRMDCARRPVEAMPREPYGALREARTQAQAIADAIPGAELTVEAREHRCRCLGCGASLTRYGALVRIAWGHVAVSREYGLGE